MGRYRFVSVLSLIYVTEKKRRYININANESSPVSTTKEKNAT